MEVRPQVYKEDDKKQLSIKVTLSILLITFHCQILNFSFACWSKCLNTWYVYNYTLSLWKSSIVIFCVFQKIIKHQYFCWQKLHLNLKYLKHIKSKKRKSGKASEYFFAHFMTRTKYWEEIAIDCECSWKSHIWQWKLLDLLRFRIFGQIAEWNYDGLTTWYFMRKTVKFDKILWSISGKIEYTIIISQQIQDNTRAVCFHFVSELFSSFEGVSKINNSPVKQHVSFKKITKYILHNVPVVN